MRNIYDVESPSEADEGDASHQQQEQLQLEAALAASQHAPELHQLYQAAGSSTSLQEVDKHLQVSINTQELQHTSSKQASRNIYDVRSPSEADEEDASHQ